MTKLTFCIGDVHGCANELTLLIKAIREKYPEAEKKFVFLGDYIDRGPDSKGVINIVQSLPEETIALAGNHDVMLVGFMLKTRLWRRIRETGDNWYEMMYGNWSDHKHTIRSYEFADSEPALFDIASRDTGITDPVFLNHLEWLRNRPLIHTDGLRTFVHAGLPLQYLVNCGDNPSTGIYENFPDRSSLVWVREEFLNWGGTYPRLIVHGHTPTSYGRRYSQYADINSHELLPNRLNLDTACVFGGRLTAAVFNDSQRDPIDYVWVDSKFNYRN